MTESLHQMFGQSFEQQNHEAIKAIMNGKVKSDTSICDHVNKIFSYINKIEVNEAGTDEATYDLETLSPNFL